MALAASSPSRSIPSSDSDSDLEPNSRGARLFWGNIKTPEKSGTAFVDPPQTVVRTKVTHPSARRKSARLSILKQAHDPSNILPNSRDEDKSLQDQPSQGNPLVDIYKSGDSGHGYFISNNNLEKGCAHSQPVSKFSPKNIPLSSSPPPALPEPLVGNNVERFSTHSRSPIDIHGFLLNADDGASEMILDSQHLPDMHRKLATSMTERDNVATLNCPDLISFGTSAPPMITNIDTSEPCQYPIPSARSSSSTSSYMAVDDMLSSEPNMPDEDHTVEVSMAATETKQASLPEIQVNSSTQGPSFVTLTVDPQVDNGVVDPNSDPSKGTMMLADVIELASMPIPLDTPRAAVDPLGFRRDSPLKNRKRKERSQDIGTPGSSPIRMRTSPLPEEVSEADRLAKTERRVKAKYDTERQRQQLLSLSPTSVDILDLLASPPRESPSRQGASDMMAVDEVVSHVLTTNLLEPAISQETPARRVLVEMHSPQRRPATPIRFMRPVPMSIDDPNRTPAQRIQVSPPLPKPLPLNDPNRIPARRVPIAPSPTKSVNSVALTLPKFKLNAASPIKPTKSTSPVPEQQSPFAAWSRASLSKVLPSSSQPALDNTSGSTGPASLGPISKKPTKQATSNMGPSSFSRHSGIAAPPSRLPIPSTSLRPASPSPSAALTTFNNVAGSSRLQQLPRSQMPSRIPSPIKRQTPIQELSRASAALPCLPSSSKVTPLPNTRYSAGPTSRKRRRVLSDSDPDEPPSKRPVVTVRPVVKGMFSEGSRTPQRNDVFSIASHTMGHSVPSSLPSGVSSSECSITVNSTIPPSAFKDRSYQAESSSMAVEEVNSPMDTDTASTVTLSREPTLDDVTSSGQENALFQQTELRRTARIRRPPTPDPFIASAWVTATPHTAMVPKRTSSRTLKPEATIRPVSRAPARSQTTPSHEFPSSPKRLRTVTTNNTIRNQVIVADLQRTVVRKSGPRPPSPTTKVRNREKSKEELSKERERRAERRRRRSDGSNMDSSDFEDLDKELSPLASQKTHLWAPGDDEDYATPERPPKPSRWDPTKIAKCVKWSQTLVQTMVFLDEESDKAKEPIPQPKPKFENRRKSCLFHDTASLNLDALGNVLNATEPVPNLERERIQVTKLVYDNDIEELPPRTTRRKKS